MALDTRVVHPPGRTNILFGPGAIAMFAFLTICALVAAFGSKDAADTAGFLGVFFGSGITGLLFIYRSRLLSGRERLGWALIGSGLLLASTGVLSVAVMFFSAGDAPAFGLTDLFFFATYITIIAGFAVLPHTHGSALDRTRMAIDGMIGAVFIGAVLWAYVLSDLMSDLQQAPMATRVIGGVYPFFDLAFLTIAVLVLVRRSTRRFDTRLALFAVGVVAQVIADVMFLMSARSGSFDQADPFYVMNLIGVGAFFASAYLLGSAPPIREYAERTAPLWTVMAPYFPALGMLILFLVDTYRSPGDTADRVLLLATIIVGLLVVARQGVAIAENRAHIEQQRNALVSTISHELRTPLTAIAGFVELMKENDGSIPEDEQREMLEIVHQQTGYMSRIVSDLIMLARGAGNDIDLKVSEVSMPELVTSAIHSSGVSPESVEVDCGSDVSGFVDPERLQQVLVNLLTNAARYGGSHRLVRVSTKGSGLVLEVHDDGAGIPRRYEVRVWDRFERGPNRLNAAIPGSGIGLAIVQAIARAHGGTATYRTSEELGGACFVVTLPARGAVAEVQVLDPHFAEAVPIRPVA